MELVDTQDLGSCVVRREGSSPLSRTNLESSMSDKIVHGVLMTADGKPTGARHSKAVSELMKLGLADRRLALQYFCRRCGVHSDSGVDCKCML